MIINLHATSPFSVLLLLPQGKGPFDIVSQQSNIFSPSQCCATENRLALKGTGGPVGPLGMHWEIFVALLKLLNRISGVQLVHHQGQLQTSGRIAVHRDKDDERNRMPEPLCPFSFSLPRELPAPLDSLQ